MWIEVKNEKIVEDKPVIQDCFLIFSQQNICYYNIREKRWDIGDFIEENSDVEPIPHNSSIAHFHGRDYTTNFMVTGGIKGNLIKSQCSRIQVKGEFTDDSKKSIQLYAKLQEELPPLPEPLMQHQSVALRISHKTPNCALLVIGGISGSLGSTLISNKVYSIFFNEIYKEFDVIKELGKPKNAGETEEQKQLYSYTWQWVECAPMKEGRHSFAICSFDSDTVYAFGGVTATAD